MMGSETPRTDEYWSRTDTLERELTAARAEVEALRAALNRIAGRCDAEASYKIARAALAKEKSQ